jgi:hypothetical protein
MDKMRFPAPAQDIALLRALAVALSSVRQPPQYEISPRGKQDEVGVKVDTGQCPHQQVADQHCPPCCRNQSIIVLP